MEVFVVRFEVEDKDYETMKKHIDDNEIRKHLRELGIYALLENVKDWEKQSK